MPLIGVTERDTMSINLPVYMMMTSNTITKFTEMSNNKQQTAVEWLVEKMLTQDWYTYKSLEYIKQAKEMENQQSQLYATFCLGCINKNLPVIKFEDWIKLGDEQ
jgi:hypothetical protein